MSLSLRKHKRRAAAGMARRFAEIGPLVGESSAAEWVRRIKWSMFRHHARPFRRRFPLGYWEYRP